MIEVPMLTDSPVAVLGLGRSGVAAARALVASGVLVWAWDDDAKARAEAGIAGIPLIDLYLSDMRQPTLLVLSPGIPHRHPRPHPVVERAQAADCDIVGDVELLVRARPDATYVGVTGTNGKSTATALIGHILDAAGRAVAAGANLGEPALALAPLDADGVYVLELSSYQLELVPSLRCDVAVLLNISPDHLERHGGFAGYVAAKRRILAGQRPGATAVVGVDDDECRRLHAELAAGRDRPVVPVSGRGAVAGGVYAEDGVLYDATEDGEPVAVLDLARAPALPGEHNAQNAAAAFAAARALGVGREPAAEAIATFAGLAHRQERIAVVGRVAYVNDSKATNAEAAARALACYDAVYWIAGGRPKEGGLGPLEPHLGRVRHAYLIGEAADAFAAALAGRVQATRCGTLDRAFGAASVAAANDPAPEPVVLLSPACASFDQFPNFEARGDAFRALVGRLAA